MSQHSHHHAWDSWLGWSTISADNAMSFTIWFTGLPATGKAATPAPNPVQRSGTNAVVAAPNIFLFMLINSPSAYGQNNAVTAGTTIHFDWTLNDGSGASNATTTGTSSLSVVTPIDGDSGNNTINGNADLVILGTVILNVVGSGQATPIDFTGGSVNAIPKVTCDPMKGVSGNDSAGMKYVINVGCFANPTRLGDIGNMPRNAGRPALRGRN